MKLISVFGLLIMAIQLLSAAEISITSVSVPSSVNQGAGFTLTAYVQGDSVQDVSGTISLPSGISCTPTSAQSISLSNTTSGTGSSSWSCTGDVSGNYANQITVTAQGTPTSGGSAISDSEQTGLSVLAPASIVSSSSLSASSVAASSTTASFLTVSVNNAGDVSTSVTITPTSSGGTFSPTAYSSVTVDGNSVVTKTFSFTAGSTAGSYSITSTVTSSDAGTSTSTALVNITATATATATATPTTSTTGTQSNPGVTPPPSVATPTPAPRISTPIPATPTPSRKALVVDTPTPTPVPYKAEAEAQIKAAESAIADAKAGGLDVTESEKLIVTAKDLATKGNYESALNNAKAALEKVNALLREKVDETVIGQIFTPKGGFNWTYIFVIIVVVTAFVFSYIRFAEKRRMKFHQNHPATAKPESEGKPKKLRGEIDFVE
ncbi:MAG: hypothetical protein AABX01_01300 [Candidatus Micrarchaeota archaeon]